jgi:hypothetical protein
MDTGFSAKFAGYNELGIIVQRENPWIGSMGPWTGRRSQVHNGPAGGAENGHGVSLPARGTRAVRGSGSHRWKSERKWVMRQSRGGAHWSMGNGGEAT